VDRCEPAGTGPATALEQLERVGHLVQRRDARHAERVEHRVVRAVLPGQRAGMRGDEPPRFGGPPHLQRDDRDVALGGQAQRVDERCGVPRGLQEQPDRARALQFQGVP
jgi:hypothetical protein